MTTLIVNCKYELYDVYIGRGSIWGNQFKIGKHGNRKQVIEKYKNWILKKPELLALIKPLLKDKILGCYCKPKPCHGDILVEIADGGLKQNKELLYFFKEDENE